MNHFNVLSALIGSELTIATMALVAFVLEELADRKRRKERDARWAEREAYWAERKKLREATP